MNQNYKKDFIQAGAIARDVRAYGKGLIQKGASYNSVIAAILKKIEELGGKPAFPPQIALDDVAAHFLPQPGSDIIFSNELVKLDIGVCFKGAIGDCAVSVDLSGKHQILIDAAEAALLAVEKEVKVGMRVRDIGALIEKTIMSFGLSPVRNLSGHGLGKNKVHTAPLIPNYDDRSHAVIKPGMTFAVEPFATNGRGLIYEGKDPTIFSQVSNRKLLGIKAKPLLEKIHTFEGLPFSMHELIDHPLPYFEVKQGLQELMAVGVIAGYPPLIEEGRGLVAQAENSFLIDEKGQVFVTTR